MIGELVVLDTATPIIYIGTLVEVTDHTFVLNNADMHDCRDGQWLKPSRDYRALLERLQHCILGDYGIQLAIRKVIWNEVLHHFEPEFRDLRQYLPLARHGIGHYDVIG